MNYANRNNATSGKAYFSLLIFNLFLLNIITGIANCSSNYNGGILIKTPDARGRALVDGGGAYASGASSSYYNPANLVIVSDLAAELSNIDYDNSDYYFTSIYLAKNFDKYGIWGISFHRYGKYHYGSYDNIYRVEESYFRISYAYKYNSNFSFGGSAKYLYGKGRLSLYDRPQINFTGNSFAFDFGLKINNILQLFTISKNKSDEVKPQNKSLNDGISLGLALTNLGPDYSYDDFIAKRPLPRRLRLSLGYQVIDRNSFGLKANFDLTYFLIKEQDNPFDSFERTRCYLGTEISIYKCFHVILGSSFERVINNFESGFGFGAELKWFSLYYAIYESDACTATLAFNLF